jgi:indole-3-glycerol phosphate synthase
MLPDSQLDDMLACAFEHSMFVLIESFDADDLGRTVKLLQSDRNRQQAAQHKLLIGVNTRNLRTLQVDAGRLASLSSMLPADAVCVAESGLHESADVERAASLGYRMALVGSALMQSADPSRLLADMLAAGRSS